MHSLQIYHHPCLSTKTSSKSATNTYVSLLLSLGQGTVCFFYICIILLQLYSGLIFCATKLKIA